MTALSALTDSGKQIAGAVAACRTLARRFSDAKLVAEIAFDSATREARRTCCSDPQNYPISGRKEIGVPIWTKLLVDCHPSLFGNRRTALQVMVADHGSRRSHDRKARVNLALIAFGRMRGCVSKLDLAGDFAPRCLDPFDATLMARGDFTSPLNNALRKGA
ncbi:MAG: hypothetical protein AAF689_17155 [Pseudomonadota bacterium]